MDIRQEELDVFKASANRMRWFMSTAILISVLILLHVYLERFSFQEAQLSGTEAHRILNHTLKKQKCYKELIDSEKPGKTNKDLDINSACSVENIGEKELFRLRSLSYEELVHDYSLRNFIINMTDNTIKEAKLPSRQIPILGTEIPANDFVIVMALMSMVFVIGVWLNLRGVHASLLSLEKHKNPDLMRIAQLNTVFLTALENNENSLALRLRTCSLWLPFASIVAATVFGYAQPVQELIFKSDSYPGSITTVAVFFIISVIVSLLHFSIALQCDRVMRKIDRVFKSKPT
ncbi:hypothetical protein P5705_12140 [Pseudomonas entomophila]|uniref:hypothetical protein n=1 Tax=Pseudomonas entomophila TaxID=312306 RepID=UPI002406E9AC|nr:hypothetical protein [Pseudomonas entomophila]MDF9618398.1 hypothetical protein [Pseudomonas entomophila]